MKSIKILKNILFGLVLLSISVSAQDFSKAGTSAAQFLKIPVGAKAVSLAGTFASLANDASAIYWNPAGLPQTRRFEISVSHSQWIADIDHNFLGVVLPIDEKSTVGFGVIQLTSGDIEATTILQPKGTGTFFDAADLAVSVSYARQVIDDVSVGISAKYINERIWNTSSATVAFDLGVLLNTGFYGMKMGLSFLNFGPELTMRGSDLTKVVDLDPNSSNNPLVESNLNTQPFSLPTSYRASLSMPFVGAGAPIDIAGSSFILAVDAVHLNDNPEHYNVGGEYGYSDLFFIRGGYKFNTDEEGLTLGSGIKFNFGGASVSFDYAYAEFGVFDAVNIFSLSIKP